MRSTATAALAVLAGALAGPLTTSAQAASVNWAQPAQTIPSGGTPSALSCTSEALCVGVNREGHALSSNDPAAASPQWSSTPVGTGTVELSGVSCAPGGPCVAVGSEGDVYTNFAPGTQAWSRTPLKGAPALTGVSCASSSLCVAVDAAGDVWTSTNAEAGTWEATAFGAEHAWTAVSCAPGGPCVAVDDEGALVSSTSPTGGRSAWHEQKLDVGRLLAVSCASGALCVAVDEAGEALASGDPSAGAPSWTLTPIDGSERLTGVSCTSLGLCVAVDGSGHAQVSANATAAVPSWSEPAGLDTGHAFAGVSCLASGFCMALDTAAGALAGRVPVPTATTLAPSQITSGSAVLLGVVEPNEATLLACTFEVGLGTVGSPFTTVVPCSLAPGAIAGRQEVSAQLAGLQPNTTYHYRLTATNATGTGFGEEVPFTTAVSSQIALVFAHPSITGTPAVGQRLTCHPNTPAGAEARLTYAWVRDLIPIPSTDASTYTVKGQDSGHHLQCQVTATNGGGSATEKSAFVTIPMGGAPVSAGETAVGRATFAHGKISVAIACSPHASSGCKVALRLTAVDTLAGRRRVTVTLASARARLPAGAHATVSATIGAAGRRLLASRKRISAYLNVSGTVIGVIESRLARELVTLRASAGHTAALAHAADASSAGGVLAATPYMGWDTYFALGGRYSEATILEQASQMISLGLEKRGYRYVWLDVGWWHGTRGANGEITVSAKQWPHGMAWLTQTLHAAGFKVGLYTDAGPNGCGGAGQGSYDHYQQDVNTFAAWGFDAVKVDFCGGAEYGLSPQAAYSAFHEAIEHNASHRPMLLSICNFLQPEQYGEGKPLLEESAFSSYTFGPSVGNSWRTDTDVGLPGNVSFSDVLRNMDADAAAPQAAGPGHWNDPDYLAPDQGMSATQFRSQLSMWAMLAAPLMISDNLLKIGHTSLEAVTNGEVIAIDQDPAGVQGTLVSSAGNGEVWVKPLVGGARAVALLNRGSSAIKITTSASAVGLQDAPSYVLRNVWTHTTASTAKTIAAEVPGDGTVLLIASAR